MSGEEQNKGFYKETIEEISVPERLAEKVGRVTEGEEKRRKTTAGSVMRKVAMAAAILVALFVGSNGIAYAVTGETWVETMILKIKFNIKGTEYEVETKQHQLRNGKTIYVGELEDKNGDHYRVSAHVKGQGGTYFEMEGAEVWMEDGGIYIWDGDVEIDITEDFEDDGYASGTYEVNGVLKGYKLWKRDEGIGCWIEILHDGEKESFWMRDWLE